MIEEIEHYVICSCKIAFYILFILFMLHLAFAGLTQRVKNQNK